MEVCCGTDTISGTIVTDGTLRALSAADIIGGTFSFTNPQGDVYAGPALFNGAVLEATPTQLLLDPGAIRICRFTAFRPLAGQP